MDISTLFMGFGFLAASYSIVANDAIQTLGTFLSSNSKRPWWVLWLFACSVLTAVIVYGWVHYAGDVSYGRLSSKFPVPESFTWIHAIPPLVIILLTRKGVPVSTTFLILTVFAPTQLGKILTKSLLGYGVAFISGLAVYMIISNIYEKRILSKEDMAPSPEWIFLQWFSTAFLWSQWLIQDLANIFVYMPSRALSVEMLIASLVLLYLLHGVIFYFRGGEIQKIVTTKTGTQNIRSATIIDFIYALILYFFKNLSNIPMSTTWVFLGLLAGRELGIALRLKKKSKGETTSVIFKDAAKAGLGLAVSVFLALSLPALQKNLNKQPKQAASKIIKAQVVKRVNL